MLLMSYWQCMESFVYFIVFGGDKLDTSKYDFSPEASNVCFPRCLLICTVGLFYRNRAVKHGRCCKCGYEKIKSHLINSLLYPPSNHSHNQSSVDSSFVNSQFNIVSHSHQHVTCATWLAAVSHHWASNKRTTEWFFYCSTSSQHVVVW